VNEAEPPFVIGFVLPTLLQLSTLECLAVDSDRLGSSAEREAECMMRLLASQPAVTSHVGVNKSIEPRAR